MKNISTATLLALAMAGLLGACSPRDSTGNVGGSPGGSPSGTTTTPPAMAEPPASAASR